MTDGFIQVRDQTTNQEALAFGIVQGTPYWAAMSSPMQPLSFFCPEHKRLFDYRTSCPECGDAAQRLEDRAEEYER